MTLTDETLGRELAAKVITFLETGAPPEGVFTRDAFCDFTMPQWRLQGQGVEDIVRMRTAGHPGPSRVPRSRFDATSTGFVLEVEEEWDQDGESWYCRELLRALLHRRLGWRAGGASPRQCPTAAPVTRA